MAGDNGFDGKNRSRIRSVVNCLLTGEGERICGKKIQKGKGEKVLFHLIINE